MADFAVIWDMDGVLIDTGEYHYRAWAAALAREGVSFSREEFRATFGMNNFDSLAYLCPGRFSPAQAQTFSDYKEDLFRAELKGQAQLLPGVQTWLDWFRARRVPQALATSAPQANLDVLVEELNLRPYFHSLKSVGDLPGKPDPAVFLRAARELHTAPARCLVIEDSLAGVSAAKRAGMTCLAVTTTNPVAALDNSGADLIVARLDQLPPERAETLLG